MQLKKSRLVCKIMYYALTFLSVLLIFMLVAGTILTIFGSSESGFSVDGIASNIFYVDGYRMITDANYRLAAAFVVPIFLSIYAYITFKGSKLFEYLLEGNTPFSNEFAHSVKQIGLILIIYDLIHPLLYSLVLTIIIDQGYYFSAGVTESIFIGLILYVVAEILTYGVHLQEFSDDTI